MTMNVTQDRSTLSLPGARLRPDEASVRAGERFAAKPDGDSGARGTPITVSRSTPPDLSALRGVTGDLDRASAVADVALAATAAMAGLLEQLREVSASARNTGADRTEAFGDLVGQLGRQVDAANFGGVNLLNGSLPSGALRLPANADGSGEIALTARDLRPGGALVGVTADLDPASALPAVETALANVEGAGKGLGEEFKRLEAHRAFTSVLSEALAGRSDAHLDVDGARLAALQVRQALSGQTLSVGNAGPQAVLSLFR